MSRDVGIVRSEQGLATALSALENLCARSERLYREHGPCPELLELRSLACVALLVTQSAALRRESRGTHYNVDYPQPGPAAETTILQPPQPPQARRRKVA
jgi:L-aspartate oxidase